MPNAAFARSALPLSLVASMIGSPASASSDHDAELTALRARGPAALDALLARYDRLPRGRERNALALDIDRVAAQRYATVSRLYWYTDLGEAEAAARASQRPILALRMLGRLDEDLSCANSRLFRSVLYANASVGKLLREHFVLYWSSERPVPKVTIEMGDGRKLVRTTTGNSAHYVLDADGHVLDVLPGMYAPAMFEQELVKSLALATKVRTMDDRRRAKQIAAYHQIGINHRATEFANITRNNPRGFERGDRSFVSRLARAQRATMSKGMMEIRDLAAFGLDAGKITRDDVDQWASLGVALWNLQPTREPTPAGSRRTAYGTFDPRSLVLIEWLHDLGQPTSSPDALAEMVQRLEYSVIADSALDELQLRRQIRAKLVAEPALSFDALNTWIYDQVFFTPKSDPWLGLMERSVFTGLPGDGVVTP